MDTTDVDLNADRAQERFTTHIFDQPLEQSFRISGSTVCVPSDMSTWPSSAFFDAIYGSAVMDTHCRTTKLLQRRLLCWDNEDRHCSKPYHVQISVDEASVARAIDVQICQGDNVLSIKPMLSRYRNTSLTPLHRGTFDRYYPTVFGEVRWPNIHCIIKL
jgi:hypothetical protein